MNDTKDSSSNLYLCIKQFNSRLGDELNLKVGDKIEVLADDSEYNDGWYMGKNLSTGDVGLYPKSFTQILVEEPNNGVNLLRSRSRSRSTRLKGAPTSPVSQLKSNFENLSVKTDSTSPSSKPPKPSNNITNKLINKFNDSNDFNDSTTKPNGKTPNDYNDSTKKTNENAKDDETHTVHKTMNDIDKALEELQSDSLLHNNESTHKRATSNLSLTDDLDPKDAMNWTPLQVTSYFALGLGFDTSVAGKFARHKITGAILFELDLAHLKELDIDSFGTRFEVYKEIENLKKIVDGKNEQVLPAKKVGSPGLSSPYQLSTNHSRKKSESLDNLVDTRFTSPKLDKGFKFGGNNDNIYTNKNMSTSVLHPPSSHTSIQGNGLSRPASSVYDNSVHSRNVSNASDYYYNLSNNNYHHRRNSSAMSANNHKRNGSMFSFLSKEKEDFDNKRYNDIQEESSKSSQDKLISPIQIKKEASSHNVTSKPKQDEFSTPKLYEQHEEIDIDNTQFSPRKLKSINYKYEEPKKVDSKDEKRSVSDSVNTSSSSSTPKTTSVSRFKTLRTASTNNFKSLTSSKKLKTSAFQEGIRNITPDEAIKTANYSGFMAKRSGNNLSWRSRYFTLHGTRLSYFTSLKDKKEKGLIDITAHKVIPIDTDGEDKYVALYAASTGLGRYCFKILPPAPGFKKGLTFTQPKIHFFAVETIEEMRGWLKALMTATIDIDDSVPVISSYSTPTVSLAKAQELLAKAREETRLKDELRAANGNFFGDFQNFGGEDDFSGTQLTNFIGNYTLDPNSSGENSPLVESSEEKSTNSPATDSHPKLSIDTSAKTSIKGPTTPQIQNSTGGFASPYLLASGLLSPKLNGNLSPSINNDDAITNNSVPTSVNNSTMNTGKFSTSSNTTTPVEQNREYFPEIESPGSAPKLPYASNNNSRVSSTGTTKLKKRHSEKFIAYSNDGSGNHAFFIKQKR